MIRFWRGGGEPPRRVLSMRYSILLVGALLVLTGCTEPGGEQPAAKDRRPVGMSEDIWKVYSGAESGVGEQPKDKAPAKDAPAEKPPEKK